MSPAPPPIYSTLVSCVLRVGRGTPTNKFNDDLKAVPTENEMDTEHDEHGEPLDWKLTITFATVKKGKFSKHHQLSESTSSFTDYVF